MLQLVSLRAQSPSTTRLPDGVSTEQSVSRPSHGRTMIVSFSRDRSLTVFCGEHYLQEAASQHVWKHWQRDILSS